MTFASYSVTHNQQKISKIQLLSTNTRRFRARASLPRGVLPAPLGSLETLPMTAAVTQLGRTNIHVTELGFGTSALGDTYGYPSVKSGNVPSSTAL